jgi:hypothetical protein
VEDGVPGELQGPLEKVLENIGPVVPDMGGAVNRRSASIEADPAREERLERLVTAAESIVEGKHDGLIIGIRAAKGKAAIAEDRSDMS